MNIKGKAGHAFSITEEHPPIEGCTVSEMLGEEDDRHITVFSLADGTSVSAESYPHPTLYIMDSGEMELYERSTAGKTWHLQRGDLLITPPDIPIGIRHVKHAIYTEIGLGKASQEKENDMNGIKSAEVFALKDLVPYQDGKIINRDIVDNEHLKFVVMSFDKGTGLPEHAAPGEAIIFALDGTGVIGYEGKEYEIKAGQNFKFDKGGAHSVKAVNGQFKMALLLTLD